MTLSLHRDDTSYRDGRALDLFVFFVANLQTGFGPFLAVYLTTQKWTQSDIGLVLSVSSVASLLSQMPAGWMVDRSRSTKGVALLAVAGIGLSAVVIGSVPTLLAILVAKLLHVASSCFLGPSISVLTLGLVGYRAFAARLGRNAQFAAVGNGAAALAMGACGYLLSSQAVFFVTAALAIPTVVSLLWIRDATPIETPQARASSETTSAFYALTHNRAFVTLCFGLLLFYMANGSMLPLVGGDVAVRSEKWANTLIALCIVGPQIVTALVSGRLAQYAETFGRRPFLIAGFAALPIRGALLAYSPEPTVIVLVQLIDGLSAAALGVLVPLMLADIAEETGHFALLQGATGFAIGIGATLSALTGGLIADRLGFHFAFFALAGIALVATLFVAALMPETQTRRPQASDRT